MSATPRTDALCNESRPVDVFALAKLARQLERELAAQSGPGGQPVAWIATSKYGSVMHFSIADGWKVEVAQTDERDATSSGFTKHPSCESECQAAKHGRLRCTSFCQWLPQKT